MNSKAVQHSLLKGNQTYKIILKQSKVHTVIKLVLPEEAHTNSSEDNPSEKELYHLFDGIG